MNLSKKKKQELYHVICDEIVKVRIKLKLQDKEDFILAQVENKIWDRVKQVLNLSD